MRRNLTRREWLTAAGSASLLGFAGMAQADSHTTISGVPVVESADRPTMGTDSSNPTATVYGNYKCPVTQGFVFGNFQTIIEEFVVTGQLNIEFANLAYEPGDTSTYYISSSDPRMAAFGRAVWNQEPGSYWNFFEAMFADQMSGTVTYDDLANKASSAGVSSAGSAASSASGYESEITNVASTAVSDGVSWIPTMALAGDSRGPHHGTQTVLNWIDARIDEAPSEPVEEDPDDEEDEEDPADDPEPEEEVEEDEPEEEVEEEDEPEEEVEEEDEPEGEVEEEDDEPTHVVDEEDDEPTHVVDEEDEAEPEEVEEEDDEPTHVVDEEDEDDGGSCIIRDGILG